VNGIAMQNACFQACSIFSLLGRDNGKGRAVARSYVAESAKNLDIRIKAGMKLKADPYSIASVPPC
jgi:hypothetical protein